MAELFMPTVQDLSSFALADVDRRRQALPATGTKARRDLAMMEAIAEHLAAPAAFEAHVVRATYLRLQGVLAEEAELVCDARVRVAGWIQPRLVEIRIAVTPMALNIVSRQAEEMLAQMNDAGGRQQDGDAPTCWRRSRSAGK